MRTLVLVVCGAAVGCSTSDETLGTNRASQVIGIDDLKAVAEDGANVPEKYRPLLDAYGLIRWQHGTHHLSCTATHVGNGIVLTAGHCFDAPPTETADLPCDGYTVDWGYRANHTPYLTSTCTTVIKAEKSAQRDFAVFRVDAVPTASVAVSTAAHAPTGTTLTIFSHPKHRSLEWSQLCTLRSGTDDGHGIDMFTHQCDTEPGSSGATILDDDTLTVVGIHDGGNHSRNYATYVPQL